MKKLLGKEYSYLLTGRHLTIRVFPLSFSEFLPFKDISLKVRNVILERERSIIKRELENYIQCGGFPEVVLNEKKKEGLHQNLLLQNKSPDAASPQNLQYCPRLY